MATRSIKTDPLIRDAIARVRTPLLGVSAISCVSNLLMLTGPMFMMLVYDKVLASKSVATLLALCAIALVLYTFYGILESVRARLLARIGSTFDHRLAPRLFDATLRLPLHLGPMAKEHDPLQDLAQVRGFLMGSGPGAIFDMPWMPIYIAFLYFVHPALGWTAIAGAVFLVVITTINELVARSTVVAAGQSQAAAGVVLADARRNAETAAAMSMGDDLCARWAGGYVSAIANQRQLADHAGVFGAITKTSRFVLQSAMLAIGAYLVILGEMSAGAMIAGSIIVSRALAPIDQAIANWKNYAAALNSYRRLKVLIAGLPAASDPSCALARPSETFAVRDLAIVPPGGASATMAAGSFELEAGDALGIIGPSGCGKSTLARTLVGAWRPTRGEVQLDGAELSQFSAQTLGDAIGYLPQDVSLFDGSIAENISRFRKEVSQEEIIAAAKLAGVHDMIIGFPQGYETQVGEGGMTLSGGQRQRIGLARAVFGDPFLVVLDEPNSNLDPLGEEALTRSIQRLRKAGKIVVIVAHRPSAIFAANKLLSLRNGRAEMFGPKEQVLKALFPRAGQPHARQQATPKPQAAPAQAQTRGPAPAQAAGQAAGQEAQPATRASSQAPAPSSAPAVAPADAPAAEKSVDAPRTIEERLGQHDSLEETTILDLTAVRARRASAG